MASKLVDDFEESLEDVGNLDNIQQDTAAQVAQPVEEDVPEKYKGKSAKEIIAMHQEAEKLIGKQGGEVGELRKVVDDFIKSQTAKVTKQEELAISDDDFFVEPKAAITKAIDSHPAIKEAQQAALQMRRAETLNKLASDFPNFMETVQDDGFKEWVKGSKVRLQLYAAAENNFDYDAATELLSTWNDKQSLAKKAIETNKIDRQTQLKAADVGATNSSTEGSSKKKYRRSDIIRLMQTDPDRYLAMADEIAQAYAEKRVI